ncbi:unnamed protein product, partial [Porites evermanni]
SNSTERSITKLINQSSEPHREAGGEIDVPADIANDFKLDNKKGPAVNQHLAKIVHGLKTKKLSDEILTETQNRYNKSENCECLSTTKKLVEAKEKVPKDALNVPGLITAATDAITLIGATNFELNIRRRDNIKRN